ncbi:MAG: GH92 family glycosyl hydrolase [Bacteroidota bacterium]|nr:GH92 family glycosyl hydrolase [Bacteroidota bacterium]
MKMNMKRLSLANRAIKKLLSLTVLLWIGWPSETMAQVRQPVDYVNPFIGTEKSSHFTVWEARGATFPGVLLPFGMVQIGPDGYMYSDRRINSFSFLNHHSGWSSRGSFRLMAFTGEIPAHGSAFSHQQEKATPYYYQVKLEDYGINAEFTTSGHAGLCRFTFPQSGSAHLVLSDVSDVTRIDSSQIRGRSGKYYFIALFSKPFQSSGEYAQESKNRSSAFSAADSRGYFINFSTVSDEQILVRIGFSLNSYAGAETNIGKEMPGPDFEEASMKAKRIWNGELGRIEIKTSNEEQKEIFYTALYHSLFMPAVLSDADSPKNKYSSLYPWDTYRSEHPLISILEPEREGDMIASELAVYDRTGWLPTGNMMGNHNTQLILDAYVKGVRNFDISKACEAMRKSMLDSPYARREMADFVRYGYVPANVTSSVTHTLEFAYDDWAAASFLEKTGNKEKYLKDWQTLLSRARNYRNSYDPADGFMKAKTKEGEWATGGYSEGTPWTYTWYVPHDVQGLINLMGGKKIFSERLNQCFQEGHYVHDNEPPLHYAYLFNFSGQPWKTQQWARSITEGSYSADAGGIPGNDDLGALSSWFVFSAMGFYPVTPGTAQYQIGSPLFEKTTIHLSNGKQFNIIANHVSRENRYIQSATLNGSPFSKSWITHTDILSGKTLVFEMGPKPNKSWGQHGPAAYSMTSGIPDFKFGKLSIAKHVLKADEAVDLSVWVKNKSQVEGSIRVPVWLDGKPLQTVSEVLGAGEYKQVHISITLYSQGKHALSIPGLPPLKLQVQKTAPEFIYRYPEIPMPRLVKTGDSMDIRASVKNIGSIPGATKAQLLIDGKEMQSKEISLRAGEEKEIQFIYIPRMDALCHIGIGKLTPVLVRVQAPGEKTIYKDSLFSSLDARLVLDFDEGETNSIRDFSGNGNNGIVKGKLNWVEGIYGKAIQTNASQGDYIEFQDSFPHDTSGQSGELTIMAWVYPEEEKNFADIISKGDWNGLQLKGSNQIINFYANGWEGHEAMAAVPENWNRHWHHLAGVSDGTDYKLYVDGRLVETKKGEKRNPCGETGMANYSGLPWNIGRNAGSPDRVFNGYIDDVMIFRKALNQQQIENLMLHIY